MGKIDEKKIRYFLILIAFFGFLNIGFSQYDTCDDANNNPTFTWMDGSPFNNCDFFDPTTVTASGFFGPGAYVPSCDPGSLNTKDYWIKFNGFYDYNVFWNSVTEIGYTVLLLENVDCGSTSATEIYCFNQDAAPSQAFVSCDPIVVGQEYFLVILVPDAITETDIMFCNAGYFWFNSNIDCESSSSISGDVLETCSSETIEDINYYTCPEEVDYGGCGVFDIKYTVWYDFTTDANAQFVDIELEATFNGPQVFIVLDGASGCEPTIETTGCIFGGSLTGLAVLPNHTYYIVVAPEVGQIGGPFDLTVTAYGPTPAPNDDACDAIDLSPSVSTPGTTTCAIQDIAWTSCTNIDDNQVWFTYSPPAGTNGMSIEINNLSITGNIGLTVYGLPDCSGLDIVSWPFGFGSCDAVGEGPLEFFCIDPNFVYYILVGSSSSGAGEFEITIGGISNTSINDFCDDAIDVITGTTIDGELPANCLPVTLVTDNIAGCPESFGDGCGFDVGSAVWYKFTAANDGQVVDIELENESFNSSIGLYEGNCIGLALVSCVSNMNFLSDDIVGGSTYYILIGTDGNTSTFDLSVTLRAPPSNDDCDSPIVLNPGLTIIGTNECAGPDISFGSCTNYDQTVWYEFTTGDDVWKVSLVFSQLSMGNSPSINIYEGGCPPNSSEVPYIFQCDYVDWEFCVLENTTYTVLIGSTDTDFGTFELTYNNVASEPTNDICSGVEVLNNGDPIPTDCVQHDFVGTNLNACHENFTLGTCDFDLYNRSVTWYEFTTDDIAETGDFSLSNIAQGGNSYKMALFSNDCDNPTPLSDCGDDATDYLSDVPLAPNTTYFLLVASHLGFSGTFDISITINSSPDNDDCTSANYVVHELIHEIALTDETTECSTPDVGPDCGSFLILNTVWYEYTVGPNVSSVSLDITNWTSTQDVYVLATGFCNSNTPYQSDETNEYCGVQGEDILSIDCPVEGDKIYFVVGTPEGNDGNFDIKITEEYKEVLCTDNDDCVDADVVSFDGIVTGDPAGPTCITDCNIGACPESFDIESCMFSAVGGVWYEVTTDATPNANLNINLSSGDFNPMMAVFLNDCNTPLSAATDCIIGDGTVAFLNNIDVNPNTTYLILVASEDGAEGDFELCVELKTSCNDSPCSPVSLGGGFEYNDPELYCTTNNGSTEDNKYIENGCVEDLYEGSVYFTYQVEDNLTSFELVYNNVSMTGEGVVTIMEYDANDCENEQVLVTQECNSVEDINPIIVDCPEIGSIFLIQVSSELDDQGDFSLEIIEYMAEELIIPFDTLCNTIDSFNLDDLKITTESGTWTLLSGPASQDLAGLLYNGNTFIKHKVDGGDYIFEFELDNGSSCGSTGITSIFVVERPELSAFIDLNGCNKLDGNMPHEFDLAQLSLGFSGSWHLISSPADIDTSDFTSIDFNLAVEGEYVFEFCTDNAVEPCENICEELIITITSCDCPLTITMDSMVCNQTGSINLSDLLITSNAGVWKQESGPEVIVVADAVFEHNGVLAGVYELTYNYHIAIPNCDSVFATTITVEEPPSAVLTSDVIRICGNNSGTNNTNINLYDLIDSGDMSGVWTSPSFVIPSDGMIDFDGMVADVDLGNTFLFEYTLSANAVCTGQFYTIPIIIENCNCEELEIFPFPDMCNDKDMLNLADYLSGGTGAGIWISDPFVDLSSGEFDATDIAGGDYVLSYTLFDQIAGCPEYATDTITVYEPGWAGTGATIYICENENRVIDLIEILEDDPDLGGIWTSLQVEGFDAVNGTFNTEDRLVGNYTFTYSFGVNLICNTTSSIVVSLVSAPIADAGEDQEIDCLTETITLDGSQSTSNLNYQWYDDNGVILGATNDMYDTDEEGLYILEVTDNISGCTVIDSVMVTSEIGKPIMVIASKDPLCNGEMNGMIKVEGTSGGIAPYEYDLNGNGFSTIEEWDNLVSGTYTITVRDDDGCISTETIVLTDPDLLVVEIENIDELVPINSEETITIKNESLYADMTVNWTKNGEVICESSAAEACLSLSVTIEENATYCINITDANGCETTDCVTYEVEESDDIYIPTVFNPYDPDASNQWFYVTSSEDVIISNFSIYSRWGELIYQAKNLIAGDPSSGWDGKYKGADVSPGVYVYVIELVDKNGKKITKLGDVLVMR